MEGKLLNNISNWFNKFKRYTVTYKNGAYHISSLFHSPETIIESFDKMPFCTHDRAKKMQTSDTMFLKSKMFYCNPEAHFWIIVSNLNFKKNVMMRNIYDKELPVEYHFINIHIKTKTIASKSMVNGLVLKEKTWSIFKAGHALTEYHLKNSNEKNITLFFTNTWLEKQKVLNPIFKDSKLVDFFNSANTYLIIDEESLEYEKICDEMMALADDNENDKNIGTINNLSYKVITKLITKLNAEIISENHFTLSDTDRKNIQRAEAFLLDKLMGTFPGIEKTASEIRISTTKLKKDFKSYHNKSIYQYFSEHQMQLAHLLLSQKEKSIQEIAGMLGYENSSKFSARFKSIYNIRPSDLGQYQN